MARLWIETIGSHCNYPLRKRSLGIDYGDKEDGKKSKQKMNVSKRACEKIFKVLSTRTGWFLLAVLHATDSLSKHLEVKTHSFQGILRPG